MKAWYEKAFVLPGDGERYHRALEFMRPTSTWPFAAKVALGMGISGGKRNTLRNFLRRII